MCERDTEGDIERERERQREIEREREGDIYIYIEREARNLFAGELHHVGTLRL